MRPLPFAAAAFAATVALAWTAPVRAQVTDAERAAARTLFQEGDELQRAGKFAEALDKFERAQQVFSAPTNMLRIAECQAALGRLVESAESYRAVARTPLPAGAPPAFQAAVDQARGELSQVEPRVPKLVVQLDPPNVPNPQLQIDGQRVPAAILGEPFPLDPGPHKIVAGAMGFASGERAVVLKERESKSLQIVLKPIAGVTYAPGRPLPPEPPPTSGDATREVPPGSPSTAIESAPPVPPRKSSRVGLFFGPHIGLELPAGQVQSPAGGSSVDISSISAPGAAFALEGGLRFARHGYVGLTVEHAQLGAGKSASVLSDAASTSSSTTTAGVVLGIIANPDRPSFFGEIGVQERWYNVGWRDQSQNKFQTSYAAAEFLLGMGVWIPVGSSIRLLPEATAGIGAFGSPSNSPSTDTTSDSPVHAFVMLGLAGLYNIDF